MESKCLFEKPVDLKELKIVFNLQWKNCSNSCNLVCIYDNPSTTLSLACFKSYLLKNSGSTADDISLYYLSTRDIEYPIKSQLDFQLAMYSFRERARRGDIVTLILEKDNQEEDVPQEEPKPFYTNNTTGSTKRLTRNINPPSWFTDYMENYKKELISEITHSIVNHPLILKMERSGDLGNSGEIEFNDKNGTDDKIDLTQENDYAFHLIEPDISYFHATCLDNYYNVMAQPEERVKVGWLVQNTGKVPWTSKTTLRYVMWDESTDLKLQVSNTPVPLLLPDMSGRIEIDLTVPETPGEYWAHWEFCHDGLKFPVNLYLVCRVGVMAFKKKSDDILVNEASEKLDKISLSDNQSIVSIAGSDYSTVNLPHSDDFILINKNDCTNNSKEKPNTDDSNAEIRFALKNDDAENNTDVHDEKTDSMDYEKIANLINTGMGFAYVTINGEKYVVPKSLLREDFLAKSEEKSISVNRDQKDHRPNDGLSENGVSEKKALSGKSDFDNNQFLNCLKTNENLQTTQSIAVSTECLANTSYKESIHSDVNELPKDLQFPDTFNEYMNNSLNSTEIEIENCTKSPESPSDVNHHTNLNHHSNVSHHYSYSPESHRFCFVCASNRPLVQTFDEQPRICSCYCPHSSFKKLEIRRVCSRCSEVGHLKRTCNSSDSYYPRTMCPNELLQSRNSNEFQSNSLVQDKPNGVHILPNTLVTGAVNVASSAINTARSVLNLFTPSEEKPAFEELNKNKRDHNLAILNEMGFTNLQVTVNLLDKYDDNIELVIAQLVQNLS